jgi:hypothetical protein
MCHLGLAKGESKDTRSLGKNKDCGLTSGEFEHCRLEIGEERKGLAEFTSVSAINIAISGKILPRESHVSH